MLDAVVTAPWIRDVFLRIPFGDVYLHNPGRMRYLAVIAVPVLGAVGIQGLRDDPLPPRDAVRWLAAGAFLWLGVPLLAFANLSASSCSRSASPPGHGRCSNSRRDAAPGHTSPSVRCSPSSWP